MREFRVTSLSQAEQIRNQGVSFHEATLAQRAGPLYPPAIIWLGDPSSPHVRAKVLYRRGRVLTLDETLAVLDGIV